MSGVNIPKPKTVMQVILTPYLGNSCTDTINYYIDTFRANQKNDSIYLSGCNSVSYNGNVYNNSTVIYDYIKSIKGYDSAYHVVFVNIKLVPKNNNISIIGCDSVTYKSKVYNASIVLTDTVKSLLGCDSIYNTVYISINSLKISGAFYHPNGFRINYLQPATTKLAGINAKNNLGNFGYSFNCLDFGTAGVIKAIKNNDVGKANGITTLDMALIQSHILGKNKLNSPYKLIAADVNGDGKVTTLDIVYLKRLILGLDTTFTKTSTGEKRLWAFVDSSYQFPDTTNPFPFKDSISYIGLSANKTNQTFIGVKLGDVNWDWNPALARTPSKVFVRPKKFVINN